MQKNSVHLQDFPDVSFFYDEDELIADMDLVREVCSAALSIRDSKNLRVRLPLKSLMVVGNNSSRILAFKEIIADEVNVKELLVSEDFSEFADLKLQLNFKKIGAKYGSKIKEITAAAKAGKWQKILDNQIEIAGEKLIDDEFELKLEIKQRNDSLAAMALPSNDFVILLETKLTSDLENEGISRDIVRAVQQYRKEADLKISDKIFLEIASKDVKIRQAVSQFKEYISSQVLAENLQISEELEGKFEFKFLTAIENGDLKIAFKL